MIDLHLHAETILGTKQGDHSISAATLVKEFQGSGGAVGAIAASLIMVFAIVVPVTEMVLILLVIGLGVRDLEENCERLAHFSMLDVMCMGGFVAGLACAASGGGRLSTKFLPGFWA